MNYFAILYLIISLALAEPLAAQHLQYPVASAQVTTLAGSATGKSKEPVNGVGADARFEWPMGIVACDNGVVYVTDEESNTIRKITPDGMVTTLAGNAGARGSADGTGETARFYHPVGLAATKTGTLYVADADNHTIRKITPDGIVTTLAGMAGWPGTTDGSAPKAQFNCPHGVAVDAAGAVYVADTFNHTIRKISFSGQVTTLAGVAGSKGNIDGPGGKARFFRPSSIAVDASGVVYVADNGNHTIRKISTEGIVTTLAGLAGKKGSVDGLGAEARFDVPNGIAVKHDGMVYVADYLNSIIRQITPQGMVITLAGHLKVWSSLDGPSAEARFKFPFGVAVGSNGWVYVADSGNHTIRVIK